MSKLSLPSVNTQMLLRHADKRSTEAYTHLNVRKFRDVVNERGQGKVVSFQQKQEEKKEAAAAGK